MKLGPKFEDLVPSRHGGIFERNLQQLPWVIDYLMMILHDLECFLYIELAARSLTEVTASEYLVLQQHKYRQANVVQELTSLDEEHIQDGDRHLSHGKKTALHAPEACL